jgi:hypothetical protein
VPVVLLRCEYDQQRRFGLFERLSWLLIRGLRGQS